MTSARAGFVPTQRHGLQECLSKVDSSISSQMAPSVKQRKTSSDNVNTDTEVSKSVARKAITLEVIAKLKALDIGCQGSISSGKELQIRQAAERSFLRENDSSSDISFTQGTRAVEIKRTHNQPLGFFIRQGDGWGRKDGVFVSRITPGSLVDCDGSLAVGDEILEVNGVCLAGFRVHDVVHLIQIPKRLILTINKEAKVKRSQPKISQRQHSAPDLLSFQKRLDKRGSTSKQNQHRVMENSTKSTAKAVQKSKRMSVYDHNSNANQVAVNKDPETNSTVDELIKALWAHSASDYECEIDWKQSVDEAGGKLRDHASFDSGIVQNNPSFKSNSLHSVGQRITTSTITPSTTVNLIFDDDDGDGGLTVTRYASGNAFSGVGDGKHPYRRDIQPSSTTSNVVSHTEGEVTKQAITARHAHVQANATVSEAMPWSCPTPRQDRYGEGISYGFPVENRADTAAMENGYHTKTKRNPYRRNPDTNHSNNPEKSPTKTESHTKLRTDQMALPAPIPSLSSGSSPGGSPKGRRRLPSLPTDGERRGSQRKVVSPGKQLLNVPGRTQRKLPTPPSSPVVIHKPLACPPHTRERRASNASPANSSEYDGSRSPGSDRTPGTLTHLLDSLVKFKPQKEVEGEMKDPSKSPASPRTYQRSKSAHCTDIFEQQRLSMLLQSLTSGTIKSGSSASKTSVVVNQGFNSDKTNIASGVNNNGDLSPRQRVNSELLESSTKTDTLPMNNPRERVSSDQSPRFYRRFSSSTLLNKGRGKTKQVMANPEVHVERQPGFLLYPDDYANEDLSKSHAVSGMVHVRIIKATHLPFTEKKKTKSYCAIEVGFERKAFTSFKKSSNKITWDEDFEVEIQHGREMCLACSTSNREFDKPVARTSFYLAPLVRCGQSHQIIFKLQPSGFVHVELEFTELKTLLKRVQSSKKSGVFGFRLNVTSELEQSSVPLLVRKCVLEIEKRGLESVGLYRISGNARRKKELRGFFDENSEAVDISEENCPDINVITGILKDYLRELPEPLITEKMTEGLRKAAKNEIQDKKVDEQKQVMSELLSGLPDPNRHTLVFILNHLRHVMEKKEFNKMDARNLSVCLAPVMQCAPTNLNDSRDLLDLKLYLKTVEVLLQMCHNMKDNIL